jgi:hypothetical protein
MVANTASEFAHTLLMLTQGDLKSVLLGTTATLMMGAG